MKINKKTLTVIFLAILAGSLFYLYLQAGPQKQDSQTSTLPTPRVPGLLQSDVTFNFPPNLSIDIPSELLLFSVQRGSLTSSLGESIATTLQFTIAPRVINDPVYGTTYLWSETPKALSIKFRDRIINYVSGNQPADLPTGFRIAEEQIIDSSRDFMESINSQFSLKLEPNTVVFYYITSPETESVVTPQNANLVEIKYSAQLEGLPIVGSPVLLSPASRVLLDRDLNIHSANLTLPPLELTPFERRKTLTFDELKTKASTEAKLIDINNPSTLDSASDLFAGNVNVTNIYLAYYQYSSQQFVQPVFVIEGSGRTKNGNDATGIFILPAVEN